MKNYIVLGFGEWGGIWTNPQWMAYELAKLGNNVLYINPPAYRDIKISDLPRFFKRLKKGETQSNLSIKSHLGQKFFSTRINKHLTSELIKGFPRPYKILCFQPLWLDFIDVMPEEDIIFYTDDYTQVHKNEERIAELNCKIKKFHKKIVVTHKNLLKDFPGAVVENNCIPSSLDLTKVSKKNQVCFIGTISDIKVDINELKAFILNNRNMKFIFCGLIKNDDFLTFVKKQSNVEFNGLLPFYKAFEISKESEFGLMPFRKNKYTDSMFSMKFYEYILADCKVLSTKIKMFEDVHNSLKVNFINTLLHATLFIIHINSLS